jgi:hypothetical protein
VLAASIDTVTSVDAELVTFLFIGATLLFAVLAAAKDAQGRRYGVKRMALLWLAALPYFVSSAVEFSVRHEDGSTQDVKITYSTWFLLVLPVAMFLQRSDRKERRSDQTKR